MDPSIMQKLIEITTVIHLARSPALNYQVFEGHAAQSNAAAPLSLCILLTIYSNELLQSCGPSGPRQQLL
jgi:hypothetical protein